MKEYLIIPGKISGKLEELESANLVDIFNAGSNWSVPTAG
jgi:hypothetical protein